VNPTRVLLSLLAERLGQTAGRWPRQLFGGAEAPTLREAIAARVEPRLMAPDAGQFGDRPLRVFHGTPEEFSPEGIRPWSHFGTENAARQRLEALVDPQHRGAESGPPMRVLPYEITGRRIDVGAEPLGTGDISPGQISDMLQRGGGAAGAGNAADRFRTNDTPVPVNEGWDTAGSLQQGVDDLAAQRGGWDTMGGRDMGEALIRRHGLDGALEQINRIMADPASRRARQRNGDQGAWEAVQRYIQASVNRRGIGLAPDAPNAGQRGGNGAALAALATLPPGAITLRELLRDHYGTA